MMGENHRRRTKCIRVKVFEEELRILENQCERFSMSKSEFLRNCILFGGVYRPERLEKDEIKKLIYELNRIGNNINQIAYNANSKKSTDREDMLALTHEFNEFRALYKEFAYETKSSK